MGLPGDFGTARIAERGSEQFFSLQEGEIWNSRIAILAILTYVVQEFASGRHLCAARRARGGAGHPREEGAGRQLAPGRLWHGAHRGAGQRAVLLAARGRDLELADRDACNPHVCGARVCQRHSHGCDGAFLVKRARPPPPRAHGSYLRWGCIMLESFVTPPSAMMDWISVVLRAASCLTQAHVARSVLMFVWLCGLYVLLLACV